LIGSAVFAGLMIRTEPPTDRPTQTDHVTPFVTVGCIYVRSMVTWCNNSNIHISVNREVTYSEAEAAVSAVAIDRAVIYLVYCESLLSSCFLVFQMSLVQCGT